VPASGARSAPPCREWRAALIGNGVSVSVAAKAYRLLRAIMTTAVDEDNMLPAIRAGSMALAMKMPPRGRC
jgi:hypothetical protein